MSNIRSRVLCTIVAGLCSGGVLMAQQTFGAFKGRVTDKATGNPKGAVTITILNQGTGYTRTAVTAADGTFRFQAVPLGNYRILFKSADSTSSVTRTSQLGVETDASIALAPALAATVTVVATADTVDQANTNSAEVGVNVSADRLESLPVLSRNVVAAAVLAPGVQLIAGSNVDPTKKTSTYMSTGEGQGRGTNFNIDGGDNNSTDVGGYVSPIPMDAIGEFQVVTNQYKAEFGRSNAGFLNVVSKSGSNAFTGIVSGQYTNQSMRARSTDEGTKKDNNSQTISATVAGPIIKDKLFYMFSVERKKEEAVPTTFATNAVAAYPSLGGLMAEVKETNVYARLDWSASQTVNATFTYGYDKNETPNQAFSHTTAVFGRVDPSMLGNGLNKTNRYGVKVTTNLTPNMIWESNLVYFDYTNLIQPGSQGDGVGNLQIRTRNSTLLPLQPTELGRVGHDPNAIQNTGIKRTQWRNDVAYQTGDHFLKAGIDYQAYTYADQTLFYPETGPYVFFESGITFGPQLWGNVPANTNVVGLIMRPKGVQEGDKIKQYGFYAQDDWTLTPNFSIYLGIRADKDTSFDFLKNWAGLYSQIGSANPMLLHGTTPPDNKTYISPRLQAIYKPRGDDSLTLKLGYGRFVANVIDNVTGFSRALNDRANGLSRSTFNNQAALTASGASAPGTVNVANFSQGTTLTNVNGHALVLPADLTPYNYTHNVNGLRDYFLNTVDGWLTQASFGTAGKQLMASDFEYPTTDTFNLGMTVRIGEHQNVDLQYIHSKTKHASSQFASDGSAPEAWSPAAQGVTWAPGVADMGDTVFLSNQTSSSHQLQVKWSYTSPAFTGIMTFVAKDVRSSYGGSSRSFDNNGSADFYGAGAVYPYKTNPERPSVGTEHFSGSFAFTYNFDFGTHVGVLGTWHSGKFYDIYNGYNNDADPVTGYPIYMGAASLAHPNYVIGTGVGDWNLDMGLRISHTIKFTPRMILEPFVTISNLLNNYDYGSNYNNQLNSTAAITGNPLFPGTTVRMRAAYKNSTFGNRGLNYQANGPRTAAFGFKFVF
ncbi:TonB-dependent receptor domain-containing protein [Geothrix sp. 21YS21S-2]|uniref:TonB-dependent receptor n=1 Tax=Geothrix sp. 21YS21S-2 TaxID=3068893 RepID=UPI0027B97CBF|nr:TonB-dependent receptor [Geothrix sp. 21YS21S-2]